jgi:signal transduction histidine kinase/ActR/RegA family two-component response regulator
MDSHRPVNNPNSNPSKNSLRELLEKALASMPAERADELRHSMVAVAEDNSEAKVASVVVSDSEPIQKKMEEMRATIQRLEGHNMELMQENSQLESAIFQANDMALRAESASQSKSQFLADMSHEIRTPMTAVLGMASMMEGTNLTVEQRDFVETIRTSGETLIELINDILDFSKIEAGRIDLECIATHPGKLVTETINLLRIKAEAKGLYLRGNVAQDVPDTLAGDPTRIRQILINLVGNAIKFTSKGGVEIAVKIEKQEDLKTRLLFSVTDTGIGIAKDRIDRLFRPFSQVDSSTTRKFGGTGLGLAISSKLCELMGGKMCVNSAPGVGSTFYFNIELLPAPMDAAKDADDQTEAENAIDPAKVRLLLAEDNAINSKVAMLLLKRAGYAPDLAEDGEQVLEAYRKGKEYDIILMDMQMPVMDGLEATRKLRKMLARKHGMLRPYIVALTASAGKPDHDRCIDAGMDAFLSKPIRLNEMLSVLKTAPVSKAP